MPSAFKFILRFIVTAEIIMISKRRMGQSEKKHAKMRYTEKKKKVHQKIPQTVSRTTSNASIFLVIFFFRSFSSASSAHRKKNTQHNIYKFKDEICCARYTMHFNALAHCEAAEKEICGKTVSYLFSSCANVVFRVQWQCQWLV